MVPRTYLAASATVIVGISFVIFHRILKRRQRTAAISAQRLKTQDTNSPSTVSSEAQEPPADEPTEPKRELPITQSSVVPLPTSHASKSVEAPPPFVSTKSSNNDVKINTEKCQKHASSDVGGELQPVYIGYGSQTGCAKSIAQGLLMRCRDQGIPSECMELDEWKTMKPALSELRVVVVVISTTGDGDPPMGSEKLYRFIKRKSHGSSLMSKTRFAVLALGDTNYDKFCFMGKFFHRRLKELGAVAFKDLVCADEGTGQLDDVVEGWLSAIVTDLKQLVTDWNVPSGGGAIEADGSPQAIDAKESDGLTALIAGMTAIGPLSLAHLRGVQPLSSFTDKIREGTDSNGLKTGYYTSERAYQLYDVRFSSARQSDVVTRSREEREAIVVDAQYLTGGGAKAERRVVHVELLVPNEQTSNVPMTYKVGDSIGLRCPNDPQDAASMTSILVERTGVNPDLPFTVVDKQSGSALGVCGHEEPITLRRLLKDGVDLSAPLRPGLVSALAEHATDATEAKVMKALSSRSGEGRRAFEAFVRDQALHLVELLECFPSCAPPLALIAVALPPLAPRYYSIASSPVMDANTHLKAIHKADTKSCHLSIAFSVDLWQAQQTSRTGLCTGYLENLLTRHLENASSARLPLFLSLRPSSDFTLPGDPSVPVIMVGPGTGVAPFMGFIAQRRAQLLANSAGLPPAGDMVLYYGGRHQSQDWLFQQAMTTALEDNVLTRLRTAWSRDGPVKRYVQHCMEEDADMLGRLIVHQGAYFFVCGDGRHMAPDVHAALVRILSRTLEGSSCTQKDEKAVKFLDEMKSDGRYAADIWST